MKHLSISLTKIR